VRREDYVLNAEGIPNPGYLAFASEVREASSVDIPVIVSIYGVTVDDYARVAVAMEEAGADALEIGYAGSLVKSEISPADPDAVEEVVRIVKKEVSIPVIAKLSLRDNLRVLAKAAAYGGADALAAIHAVPAMMINVETGKPYLGRETGMGGLSGPSIKPIAVKAIADIALTVDIPIIGIGGITTGLDAIEMLMAGAHAVAIHTAILLEGVGVFRKILKEIEEFMDDKKYRTVKDLIGVTLNYIRNSDPFRQIDERS
jgi:dihydroorotate dehydrogenase (NAD+) catalytic subunit